MEEGEWQDWKRELKCTKCDYLTSDAPQNLINPLCPKCGNEDLKKVIARWKVRAFCSFGFINRSYLESEIK